MGDPLPARKDDPATVFRLATAEELEAHRALGQMSACTTLAEFSEGVREFFTAVRCISRTIARLGHASQHPLEALHGPPRVIQISRAPLPPRPDDFFLENIDHKPALAVCSEYLHYISALMERSRQTLQRLGYTV